MTFKNINGLPWTTCLLISTVVCGADSVNAFQSGSIVESKINTPPTAESKFVDAEASAPAYSPYQTDTANGEMDWFGTVMRFPAELGINPAPLRQTNRLSTANLLKVSQSSSAKLGIGAAQVIVHPPQHSGPNQFSFLIENAGSENCSPFQVEFITPENVSIVSVYPVTNSLARNTAAVRFDGLAARETVMVHVLTTPAATGSFDFKTHIQLTKTQVFPVQTDHFDGPAAAESSPVTQHRSNSTTPYRMASSRGPTGAPPRTAPVKKTLPPSESAPAEPTSGANPSANEVGPMRSRLVSPGSILTTSLAGAEILNQGRETDFEIEIRNPFSQPATEIIAQLQLPAGLKIANLDREAWFDQRTGTVSWKIKSIAAKSSEMIHYRVQVLGTADQKQRVMVGMNGVFQGAVEMTSRVGDPNKNVGGAHKILEN